MPICGLSNARPVDNDVGAFEMKAIGLMGAEGRAVGYLTNEFAEIDCCAAKAECIAKYEKRFEISSTSAASNKAICAVDACGAAKNANGPLHEGRPPGCMSGDDVYAADCYPAKVERVVKYAKRFKASNTSAGSKEAVCATDPAVVIGADVYSEDPYTHEARETAEFTLMQYRAMGRSTDAGNLGFSGPGTGAFICFDETYAKGSTELALDDVSECMSSKVEVTQVRYCSDNGQGQVSVSDPVVPLPIATKLNKAACTSAEEFAIYTGGVTPCDRCRRIRFLRYWD